MRQSPANAARSRPRHLVLVLGDQLDSKSTAFDGFDSKLDAAWMAEVAEESTHVWTHIQRMSNYCAGCRFDPAESTGDNACPFTTLYWDFLLRHEKVLASNQRMTMQLKNLARLDAARRTVIQQQAAQFRAACRSNPGAI